MRKYVVLLLAFLCITTAADARRSKKYKKRTPQETNFTGIIKYYGKVTRLPDKSRTAAKLFDFEDYYTLYLNENFTKRVEKYENVGLGITITQGINTDFYMQTVSTRKEGNFLTIATQEEIEELQLTPKYMKTNSLKMKKVGGKKRINGYVCRKAVSNIITQDNIRIQLIAWYCPELYIKGYQIPYFPNLQGIALRYDTFNGQHVVTYNATDIDKKSIKDNFFGKPDQMVPLSYREFVQQVQQIGNAEIEQERNY